MSVNNKLYQLYQGNRQLAYFYRCIGFVSFLILLQFICDSDFFFTSSGMLNNLEALRNSYAPSLLSYTRSPLPVTSIILIGIICSILIIIGHFQRSSCGLLYFVFFTLTNRCLFINYGGLQALMLFLLIGTIIKKDKPLADGTVFFGRLLVCSIYFFSGLSKLMHTHWVSGKAFQLILLGQLSTTYGKAFATNFPFIAYIMNYFVLLLEISVPLIIWHKNHRSLILALLIFFHLSISIFINVHFFGLIMISGLCLFLEYEQEKISV